MSKTLYHGFVYFVSIGDQNYVVKINHLAEFASLMHDKGAVLVTDFVKTKVVFDHEHCWYKTV